MYEIDFAVSPENKVAFVEIPVSGHVEGHVGKDDDVLEKGEE